MNKTLALDVKGRGLIRVLITRKGRDKMRLTLATLSGREIETRTINAMDYAIRPRTRFNEAVWALQQFGVAYVGKEDA